MKRTLMDATDLSDEVRKQYKDLYATARCGLQIGQLDIYVTATDDEFVVLGDAEGRACLGCPSMLPKFATRSKNIGKVFAMDGKHLILLDTSRVAGLGCYGSFSCALDELQKQYQLKGITYVSLDEGKESDVKEEV